MLGCVSSITLIAENSADVDACNRQTPESYISAITRSNTWGGAIELSCLAAVYNVEICSIDVMSGRIDRFNSEGRSSIILIYSGIREFLV